MAVSGPLLVTLAPLMWGASYLVSRETKAPGLFEQERIGLHGTPFKIHKIQTMRIAFDEAGRPLPDEERTGPIGKFLRKSKIDELPQLRNVWKGEMSLVGPRPLTKSERMIKLYGDLSQDRRHSTLPGLTGLVQLKNISTLSAGEVISLDHQYVDNQSFWNDLVIIAKTPWSIFKNRKGPHRLRQSPTLAEP